MPVAPIDLEMERYQLERQQQLADMMRARSMQGAQPYGNNRFAMTTPLDILASVMEARAANRMTEGIAKGRADLARRSREGLQEGISQMTRLANGYEAESKVHEPNADGSPVMRRVPGDQQAAINYGLSHWHPKVQEIAEEMHKQRLKGQVQPKQMANFAHPQDVLNYSNDPSKWRVKPEIANVGGILYDKNTQNVVKLNGPQPEHRMVNGHLLEISPSSGSWRGVIKAPSITINQGVESEFSKGVGGLEAKRISGHIEKYDGAVKTIDDMNDALDLLNEGIHTGPLANIRNLADTYKSHLRSGGPIPEEVAKAARTQKMYTITMDQTIEALQALGGPDSDKDLKVLMAARGGDTTVEEDVLRDIFVRTRKRATDKAMQVRNHVERLNKSFGEAIPSTLQLDNFAPIPKHTPAYKTDESEGSSQSTSGVMDLDSAMKHYGIK